jgi:hypothetical protein
MSTKTNELYEQRNVLEFWEKRRTALIDLIASNTRALRETDECIAYARNEIKKLELAVTADK